MIPLELVTQKLMCLLWLFTEDDYSLSFEESVTEDESLKEGRHSDSHRRDAKRRKNNKPPLSEDSKHLFLQFFWCWQQTSKQVLCFRVSAAEILHQRHQSHQ